MTTKAVLYECDICNCLHPWDWDSDCRDDKNRYASAQDYAVRNNIDVEGVEVRPMCDRIAKDEGTDQCLWHQEEI